MAFELPDLPYSFDALEPHIDAQTMEIHHDRHHKAYVDNANAALEGTPLANESVEQVLTNLDSLPEEKRTAVRNNAGGAKRFGSGWSWLVWDGTGLAVYSTPNQDSPIMQDDVPLLGIDVWEHAYYLSYQNKRPAYLEAWWNVVNWDEVARRYDEARG
jgi:superoxide dismutase, Fe-Mn family